MSNKPLYVRSAERCPRCAHGMLVVVREQLVAGVGKEQLRCGNPSCPYSIIRTKCEAWQLPASDADEDEEIGD